MSEVRPVRPPIENLEVKSEQTKRARSNRKPNVVPLIIQAKPLTQPTNLTELVREQLALDMERLRFNIRFIVHKRGSNLFQFVKEMHKVGIKTSREGIVRGNRRWSVQLLYITTMSLALRVPTWVMIHPDIESIWDSLDLD